MFCYGKDAECVLYKSEDECKKLDLKKLLDNPEDILKGFSKPEKNREIYSTEDLEGMVTEKNMTKSEFGSSIILECPSGFHIDGTYNIIDDFYVNTLKFVPCDKDTIKCEGEDKYMLEAISSNKGDFEFDGTSSNKYFNYGKPMGKCIKFEPSDLNMIPCDPADFTSACYIGEDIVEEAESPTESAKTKLDFYKKHNKFSCKSEKVNDFTCKHLNQHTNKGYLSDLITFTDSIDKNAGSIIEDAKILSVNPDFKNKDKDKLGDIELKSSEMVLYKIEKYKPKFKDNNPKNIMDKIRYTIEITDQYDKGEKKYRPVCLINYNGNRETILNNTEENPYYLKKNDVIEILILKNRKIKFSIMTSNYTPQCSHIGRHEINEEFGSNINSYISTNNKSCLEALKYKDYIPKITLPYNPFIDVEYTYE